MKVATRRTRQCRVIARAAAGAGAALQRQDRGNAVPAGGLTKAFARKAKRHRSKGGAMRSGSGWCG
jgi:hypothetical protein